MIKSPPSSAMPTAPEPSSSSMPGSGTKSSRSTLKTPIFVEFPGRPVAWICTGEISCSTPEFRSVVVVFEAGPWA